MDGYFWALSVDKDKLIGTVRTVFELHSFHGDTWLVVRESPDLRQLEPSAAMLVQRAEVDGIRLVRRTDYIDHEFTTTVTMVKRLRAGVQEADPLARANPGRDASWCDQPDDVLGDVQRQVMRVFFAKYLDEKRLTPLEVLTYEVHAKALDGAGTVVQGALQRLASIQVRGTKQTAVSRMKELMALADNGLARLLRNAKTGPALAIGPGGLAALFDAYKGPADQLVPALYRALAAYLADTKNWVEKLDRLFQLANPALSSREMRLLDSLAAEILASPFALKELAGQETTRLDLVLKAIDLYVGNLAREGGVQLPGVRALSTLLADGALPRTLAELRLGLLRHLHARLPLRSDRGIRDEMQATVEVLTHLRRKAPALARDEEVLEALSQRADRLIQPEAMSELIGPIRSTLTRAETVLSLAESAPGDAPKAKIATYLRPLIAPEDIIREEGSRLEAIKTLATLARRVAMSGMPVGLRREMLDILDTAIFENIRTEILSSQTMNYTDRILAIIRLCGGLPEGRARQLAGDQLTQALKRPEFILNYLERFPGAQERRDAYFKLCSAMAESGLVDKSLVPQG
ncbi:hypothetical protein [Niveispirillum sp. BGYR6]|uniref:hypothetical protein n=1 Tax=Niveispirillum sp. BGYR6 TaxID=2971249 RepID=UPI0022B97783|nr:hypothetical protein [Niveispirillum sp. BGYR6]MDG5494220.1 hypothetical protein [Niveispirillum sp. BGYR6]